MKQMKAVIIGASEESLHTIERAHAYGLEVIALDGNPQAAGLKAADRSVIVDISDESKTIEAVREAKADFVLTVPIGRYLTTVGAVNDALSLPGISRKAAVLCTDKYSFHKKLSEHKLRPCHCYITEEIGSDKLPLRFPAILKPRFGSGSRGIYMIFHREELKKALQYIEGEEYVLEECIAGEEYGVDGAVINGIFQMVLLRRKENTPPPARQAVAYFSVLQTDPFYGQVQEYMKKTVACTGLDECLLHADIIRGETGPFAVELSARPSGHNLHNLFTPLCTGVDEAEEYIRYRMGKAYSFIPRAMKSMMIHYFDMQGIVKQAPGQEEIEQLLKEMPAVSLVSWECHIRKGEVLAPVSDGHSVMGRGYFILESEDQEKLVQCAERIKGMFL